MLENPSEFNQSVEALLAAQKQAINAGSVAGGQHLCFMGTGIDEEDNYVNMVVSNFLQRKINFVSLALGGYKELLRMSADDPEMIVGTDVQHHDAHRAKFTEEWVKKINVRLVFRLFFETILVHFGVSCNKLMTLIWRLEKYLFLSF